MRYRSLHSSAVEDRIRCSACGSWNDPKARPHGGELHHRSLTTTVGSETVYYDGNGSQGCWFCGSPAWQDGGSLGDFSGIRWTSRR